MKLRILRLRARIHCRINIPFQISKERAEHSSSKPKLVSRSQTPFRRGLPGEMGSGVRPLMSLCAA